MPLACVPVPCMKQALTCAPSKPSHVCVVHAAWNIPSILSFVCNTHCVCADPAGLEASPHLFRGVGAAGSPRGPRGPPKVCHHVPAVEQQPCVFQPHLLPVGQHRSSRQPSWSLRSFRRVPPCSSYRAWLHVEPHAALHSSKLTDVQSSASQELAAVPMGCEC
eukprot:1149780-Pelagomonas_calceolata.AAC.2